MKILIIAVILSGAAISPYVNAEMKPPLNPEADRRTSKLEVQQRVLNRLNINDQQRQEINILQKDFYNRMNRLNEEASSARAYLNSLINDKFSDQEIEEAISKIANLKAEQLRLVVDNRRKMECLLGKEVNDQFIAMARKRYIDAQKKSYGTWPLYPPTKPPLPNAESPSNNQ